MQNVYPRKAGKERHETVPRQSMDDQVLQVLLCVRKCFTEQKIPSEHYKIAGETFKAASWYIICLFSAKLRESQTSDRLRRTQKMGNTIGGPHSAKAIP